jgi:hypothetical protein
VRRRVPAALRETTPPPGVPHRQVRAPAALGRWDSMTTSHRIAQPCASRANGLHRASDIRHEKRVEALSRQSISAVYAPPARTALAQRELRGNSGQNRLPCKAALRTLPSVKNVADGTQLARRIVWSTPAEGVRTTLVPLPCCAHGVLNVGTTKREQVAHALGALMPLEALKGEGL